MAGAEEEGLITGSYHYLWTSRSPDVAAEHYFKTAGGKTELPPAMDFEILKSGTAAADGIYVAHRFLLLTEEKWGRPCLVYTYPSFWNALWQGKLGPLDPQSKSKLEELAKRDLWLAHYGVRTPNVPWPWKAWKIWQYDGDGGEYLQQPGGVVDSDFCWFDGDPLEYVVATGGRIKPITSDPLRTPRSRPLWEEPVAEHTLRDL